MHRIPRHHLLAVFLATSFAAVASDAAVLAPTQPVTLKAWARLDNGYTFQSPRGVTLLPNGDLAVADWTANRVVVMSPEGKFRSSFGGVQGSGPGEFQNVAGVAVNSAGEFWAVDNAGSRLQRFAADGTFLQAVGSLGSGEGQFQYPSAIAIGPSGDIYVCDQHNHRIVRLSPAGAFLSQWGTLGSGTSQFQFPSSLAIDKFGDVYVTDLYNDRVQKFARKGTWIRSWGTTGSANGQFKFPAGIAVDHLGSVFVGETGGQRIQQFTDTGTWMATINGAAHGPQGLSKVPTGMVTNRRGQLFVAEHQSVLVQRFDYNPLAGVTSQMGNPVARLALPNWFADELAADDQGGVYILNNKLQVSRVNANAQVLVTWNASPDNAYETFHPTAGIAFHAGRVYVTDPIHGAVRVYERDGTPAGSWGSFPLTIPGGTFYLTEIRIDADGIVYIQGPSGVEKFDLAGNPLGSFALSPSVTHGRLDVQPDGENWSSTTFHLQRRTPAGDLLISFPHGSTNPELTVQPGGGVLVADRASNRLRRLDADGNVLETQIVAPPPGQIITMFLLNIDSGPQGGFWLSDANHHVIQRYLGPAQVLSVQDQDPDQGGQVALRFRAASSDGNGGTFAVNQYKVFRKLDGVIPPDANPSPELPGWELVHTLPANGSPEYEVNVATREDAVHGAHWLTTYLVRAQLINATNVDSDTRTGFSTDELAPDVPTQVSAVEDASGTTLQWQAGVVAGTRYRIHRSATAGFEAHEGNVIAETANSPYLDAGVTGATYAIEAMDDAGNLSESVQFNAQGVLDTPPGGKASAKLALRRLMPNPSDGRTVGVQLSLADAGPARIELFDASGRRVHEQQIHGLPPGAHELQLQPSRRLATGVYVMRLSNARESRSLRMLVVR